MKAYVVLHGQTDFDAKGLIIGSNDPELNDTGREESRNIAQQLSSKHIDMIIASPLLRTIETAEIIADSIGLDSEKITKGLKIYERSFGELDGRKKDEVDMFVLTSWFGKITPPNGEHVKDTVSRVIAYMNNMVRFFRTKTMLIVVPEHILRALNWFFNGLPKPGKEDIFEVKSCHVYEFDTDNIPQEIKDYSPEAAASAEGDDGDDLGRLLTQDEIDALIQELTGGKL